MEATEKAASDCGNAMCEKYNLTIGYSIPCEDAFLQGVEYARDQTKSFDLNLDILAEKKKQLHELQRTTFTCKQCSNSLSHSPSMEGIMSAYYVKNQTYQAMKQTISPAIRTRGSYFSKIENQIGCGWCANEKTCSKRDRSVNKALLGCTGWKHYTETETPANQSEI